MSLALYIWHLSTVIDKHFSARRWSIPSRVYSDSMLLYPGQTVNPKLFHEKLSHLDYRDVLRKPELKGEMYRNGPSLDIYLHDLKTPSKQRKGFPAKIIFEDKGRFDPDAAACEKLFPDAHADTAPKIQRISHGRGHGTYV
jgi:penicillin-binding protein 1B